MTSVYFDNNQRSHTFAQSSSKTSANPATDRVSVKLLPPRFKLPPLVPNRSVPQPVTDLPLAKRLVLFAEKSNETDLDESIADSLLQQTLPISNENPFYGTDLLVFSNAFTGQLPTNGIKKSEFERITGFFNNFSSSKFEVNGDVEFVSLVKESFKKLLTRKIGRDLIDKIQDMNSVQKIHFKFIPPDAPSWVLDSSVAKKENIYTIFLRSPSDPKYVGYVYTQKFEGRKLYKESALTHQPFFIVLGHELMHITNGLSEKEMADEPTLSKNFHSLNEQVTITGIFQPNQFNFERNVSDNITEDDFRPATPKARHLDFNENALRSVFSMRHRIDHEGKKLCDAAEELIYQGDHEGLQKFILENPALIKVATKGQRYIDSLLTAAIAKDRLECFKVIINHGGNAFYHDPGYQMSALRLAARYSPAIMLHYLVTYKVNLSEVDAEGNTLVHDVCRFSCRKESSKEAYEMLIEKFIALGVDLRARNGSQESPLHLIVKDCISVKAVSLVMKAYENVDIDNSKGENPLHKAMGNPNPAIIQLLLAKIDMYKTNSELVNSIYLAFAKGTEGTIELILQELDKQSALGTKEDAKAKKGLRSKSLCGDTLFHAVCRNQYIRTNIELMGSIVAKLIQRGLDFSQPNNSKETCLQKMPKSAAESLKVYLKKRDLI